MTKRSVLVLTLCVACGIRTAANSEAPPAPAAAGKIDQALQAELLAILEADQQGRLKIDEVAKAHGYESAEMRALWQTIAAQDALDLAKVEAMLDTRGWVGPDEVGAKASSAIFYVIQHSDTVTQQKYLPVMRAAVQAGKVPPGNLAYLEDRVALAEGRPQTYGSQMIRDNKDGLFYVAPLIDPDHVDERRAAVGLGPIAENIKHWNLTWDPVAYKKKLPELEILRWGAAPGAGGYDQPLQAQLLAIFDDNQKGYRETAAAAKEYGATSAEYLAVQKNVAARNAAHLATVTALLDQRGWISPALVGKQASDTIMLVLQTADLATRQRYLPLIRTAVQARQGDAAMLALLEDQTALDEGRPQIYGSQFGTDKKTGQPYVRPIADPDQVDARRAGVGLEPMAEYVKTQNLTWDPAAYKAQLPVLQSGEATKKP